MKLDTECQKFAGKVKYTGHSVGSIPWKSGALRLTREHGSWKLEMLYDCQPDRSVLTLDLSGRKVGNVICKETGLTLNYKKESGEALTISYRPSQKHQVRHLQAIMSEVQQAKSTAAVTEVKCEVGSSKSSTTPRKSPLWTSTNVASKQEVASPQRFTRDGSDGVFADQESFTAINLDNSDLDIHEMKRRASTRLVIAGVAKKEKCCHVQKLSSFELDEGQSAHVRVKQNEACHPMDAFFKGCALQAKEMSKPKQAWIQMQTSRLMYDAEMDETMPRPLPCSTLTSKAQPCQASTPTQTLTSVPQNMMD